MPDHPGFELQAVHERSIVRLRIRPDAAGPAMEALRLPAALRRRDGNPSICWLGPDQWLFTSDEQTAQAIMDHIGHGLENQLHAATDVSSANACFTLSGPAARKVLAMGCGIDMHPRAFMIGQCVRTQFALVPLLIVAVDDNHFELYADRTYTRYLLDWFTDAGEDPMTLE
jgi:sarcosine oxidase subunit gamma